MENDLESRVGAALRQHKGTICTAESCTGGLIAHRLTDVPGSSAYVLGGVVAYANEIKQALLGVREESIIAYGAVSEQVAAEMARGALRIFGTTLALSVTGIAGPGGGTAEKPVGLTYIGLATEDGTLIVQKHNWNGDRAAVKNASADAALQLALEYLARQR